MNLLRKILTRLKCNYCELEMKVYPEPYFTFDRRLVHLDGRDYKMPYRPIHRKYIPKHILLTNYHEVVYSESDVDLSIGVEFYAINKESVK